MSFLKALEFRFCFPRRREDILSGKLPDRILNTQAVPSVFLSIIYVCLMMQQEENLFLNNKGMTASSQMCWAVLREERGTGQPKWQTGLCIGFLWQRGDKC